MGREEGEGRTRVEGKMRGSEGWGGRRGGGTRVIVGAGRGGREVEGGGMEGEGRVPKGTERARRKRQDRKEMWRRKKEMWG